MNINRSTHLRGSNCWIGCTAPSTVIVNFSVEFTIKIAFQWINNFETENEREWGGLVRKTEPQYPIVNSFSKLFKQLILLICYFGASIALACHCETYAWCLVLIKNQSSATAESQMIKLLIFLYLYWFLVYWVLAMLFILILFSFGFSRWLYGLRNRKKTSTQIYHQKYGIISIHSKQHSTPYHIHQTKWYCIFRWQFCHILWYDRLCEQIGLNVYFSTFMSDSGIADKQHHVFVFV